MGETHGYWTGNEVEHTQFYGLKTVFISRFEKTEAVLAKYKAADVPHVFFCQINPKFGGDLTALCHAAGKLLRQGRYVTIEVSACDADAKDALETLRLDYDRFCLLMVVELSSPEDGGFAVKVAPPVVFDGNVAPGVMTASIERMEKGLTRWEEYVGDKDGEPL